MNILGHTVEVKKENDSEMLSVIVDGNRKALLMPNSCHQSSRGRITVPAVTQHLIYYKLMHMKYAREGEEFWIFIERQKLDN